MPWIPQKTVLISAYDYYNLERDGYLNTEEVRASFNHKFLFLDSGGFELQYSNNDDWNPEKYKQVILELNPHFYVGYDRIPSYERTSHTSEVISKSIDFLKKSDKSKQKVLLIHFSPKNNPQLEIKEIVEIIYQNYEFIDIIGFPEREIGSNIIQSCQFIKLFRDQLEKRQILKPIHIFGCFDPISVILFVLAGADIFDGLGWLKSSFDNGNLKKFEKSQLPFFNCKCIACNDVNWSKISSEEYEKRLLIHNLHSVEDFFYELRNNIIEQEMETMIKRYDLDSIVKRIFGNGEIDAKT